MPSVRLFSYGTLQQPDVQLATFGRHLTGQADVLPGYSLSTVEIRDPAVVATSGLATHLIVRHTGRGADEVPGTVFLITDEELAAADAYEVDDYRRVAVTLKSGVEAFVYIAAE
jgi:gamma-glutamylcyclotransferase (GGCT)/AIG2-like uncharacterized protein YtfP